MINGKNKPRGGIFVILDGIDGSGKSTVLGYMIDELIKQNKKVFNVTEWSKKSGRLPKPVDWMDYDVIVTSEPTPIWIGAAIRQELISNDNPYPVEDVANAFSLDRLVLYRRVIIPALKANKMILQDRGVSTSIAYQTIQDGRLSVDDVIALPGNKQALEWAPDHLILADLDAEEAMRRLSGRTEDDNAIFEKLEFQKKTAETYRSGWYLKLFEKYGAKVHYLDVSPTPDEVHVSTKNLLNSILKTT